MSGHSETRPGNCSRYDEMSTEELEELLRLDFQSPEDGGAEPDTLLYIAGLLAARRGSADTEEAWERFQTKYRPYADGRSLYDFDGEVDVPSGAPQAGPRTHTARPAGGRQSRSPGLRRAALLAALLAVCLFGGIVAVQAAGIDVLGAIARWTDETFRFITPSSWEAAASDGSGGDGGQAGPILPDLEAFRDHLPTWQPDGFAAREPQVTSLSGSDTVYVTFLGEDRSYSAWATRYHTPEEGTGTFEKDDGLVEEYVHNGDVYYISSNIDTLTAASFDGEWMVAVSGALTMEEMKAVIDSIGADAALLPPEYEQMEAILAAEGQALCFPQIPEGFVLVYSDLYLHPRTGAADWAAAFQRGEQTLGFQVVQRTSPSSAIYEKDAAPVEEYIYSGAAHYIFSNNGTTNAVWMIGNVEYSLWATEGAVDMKALIRSVYPT